MEISDDRKEEIMKKFDLPERKSKLDSILKMGTQAPLYCSCRSADIDKFMIMCDKCEEWFHGDCIGMKEKDAKFIKKWFCSVCIQNFGLKIDYKSSLRKKNYKKQKLANENDDHEYEQFQCHQCSNCLQNKECGNKSIKFPKIHMKSNNHKGSHTAVTARHIDIRSSRTQLSGIPKRRCNDANTPFREWARCFGPGCYKRARIGSKYCSDECGFALAKLRLITIMPLHIAEREQVPCRADKTDKARLDNIRLQQKVTAEKLQKMELKESELRKLIERVKKLPIVENNCNLIEQEDTKMYCLLCGWDIPLRSAGKHMELCFKKIEGQFKVVGSHQSSEVLSKIFCDFYDAKNKNYCKQLRFICPDHFKPGKVPENEVCGCPIVQTISLDMFSSSETFCQQSKLKCDQHFNWEYTTLAEIDFEHLKEINKMNLLVEEEGIIMQRLANRLGALGILLHSTKHHCE